MAKLGRPAKVADSKSLGGKIRLARERAGYAKLEDFAAILGMAHQSLSRIENGVNLPSAQTMFAINQVLGTNFKRPKGRTVAAIPQAMGITIPITARVAAGDAVEFFLEGDDKDSISVDPRMIRRKGKHFGLRVSGASMEEAHVLDGDIVIVQENKNPRPGDLVVADIRAEGITLKYWERTPSEVILTPANKDYETIRREGWRVKAVGVVVGVIRLMH